LRKRSLKLSTKASCVGLPVDAAFLGPFEDRQAGEFGPGVRDPKGIVPWTLREVRDSGSFVIFHFFHFPRVIFIVARCDKEGTSMNFILAVTFRTRRSS
jgi:hypothetical protein